MIFQARVKQIAKTYLEERLGEYSSKFDFLTEEVRFNKFCALCTERLHQLDLAGYVRGQYAITDFIHQAVTAYALKQLDNIDDKLSRAIQAV